MTKEPEAPTEEASRASDAGAPAPDPATAGEAVTLLTLLEDLRRLGFGGQFSEIDGKVACLSCRTVSEPSRVEVCDLRRLEGASDPADMLAVLAMRCPRCASSGTLILNFGPEATEGEAVVLRDLPQAG